MRITKSYTRLLGEFPLVPIRNEKMLDKAIWIVDSLVMKKRDSGEDAYLDVLTLLIVEYEKIHYPLNAKPQELLASLIKNSGKSQREIAVETGISQSILSRLISGKRDLSVKHIKKLSAYFSVNPSVFV